MASIFDAFMSPEALEQQRQRKERTASDIRTANDIKIQDELRTDFTAVKRYWSDVPEDHYYSEAYKAYCTEFKALETRPMALDCTPGTPHAVENKRIMDALKKVDIEKRWLEQQKSL